MGQSGTGARMGNTNSRVRGPMEADLDKYIINVTLCDCKCQSSDNTEGGFVMEEVELNIEEGDPEGILDQDVKKDKKEETLVLTGNEIVVKEDTRDEEMKEENTFVKHKETVEAENDSSSGYSSLDYEADDESVPPVEIYNSTILDQQEEDCDIMDQSRCEDVLKDFFEATVAEENFLKRRDSIRRSFHSRSSLRKGYQKSSPAMPVTLDDLEESLDPGPISEETSQCPDDIATIDELPILRSNKKRKSKLNLPLNMSLDNINKSLLTISPQDQRRKSIVAIS